ncbi:MAG: hypothetical protein J6V66_06385 [Clostridia bacterium]|nr:hypothetical protein [Clostridia bacterium]
MRKTLFKIITLLFLISSVAFCFACDLSSTTHEQHNWKTEYSFDKDSHWFECEDCTETLDKQNHVFVGNVCSVCQYEKEPTTHNCSFTREVIADSYLKTPATCLSYGVYYKSCSCGEKGSETFTSQTYGSHSYSEWQAEVSATENSDGVKGHYSCTVCLKNFDADYTVLDSIVIPTLQHQCSFVNEVAETKYFVSPATCQSPAVYYLSCKCGEAGTTTFTYGNIGTHSISTDLYYDTEEHFNICTIAGCSHKENNEAHTYANGSCICGKKEQVVEISTIEQLKAIEPNKNYILINDINLKWVNWTPIENFAGTFNGNGYTISNFTVDKDLIAESKSNTNFGFMLKNSGTITNLKLHSVQFTINFSITDNSQASSKLTRIGVIATENSGVIENCEVTGEITVNSKVKLDNQIRCGFISSYNNGTISNCNVQGNIDLKAITEGYNGYNQRSSIDAGGITATSNIDSTILNCSASVEMVLLAKSDSTTAVSSTDIYAGGIAASSPAIIKSCHSSGNITAETKTSSDSSSSSLIYVGGLLGLANSVEQCYSSCKVQSNAYISTNSSSAIVESYNYAGGLIGYANNQVLNCYATGDIIAEAKSINGSTPKSYSYAGGLVGYSTNKIENSYTTGDITSKATSTSSSSSNQNSWTQAYAGGITTSYIATDSVSNCFSSGNLTSEGTARLSTDNVLYRSFSIVYPVSSNPIVNCYRADTQIASNKKTAYYTSSNTTITDASSVTVKTASEYKTADFWFNTLNFNTNIWELGTDGYAILKI